MTNQGFFAFAQPEWLGEVRSTNDLLKERVANGDDIPSGYVLAARRQTGGRGRMDSEWQSSPEGDLTFSFYFLAAGDQISNPVQLGSLPMACALGVCDFLAMPSRGVPARCKWPNDVMVDDAKICGILTEGGVAFSGDFGLVVGIGLNLRSVPGRDSRFGRATAALDRYAVVAPMPETLLSELLACLARRILMWQEGGFLSIRNDLIAAFWGVGKHIVAKTTHGKAEGVVTGLGNNGELLLRSTDDGVVSIASVTAIEDGW